MPVDHTIQRLFLEAQDLDPAEREAFVERATRGSPALRNELLDLLSASSEADGFFDRFASRIGRDALLDKLESKQARPWPDAQPGDAIGAYTLLSEFGRGGMGTVWLAERNDGRFEGNVAIKLLAVGGIAVQRFKLEGHFLARLAHPNIARLLDAGVTDAGQPFLVLEHADGIPIDDYCRDEALSVGERIRLFLTVANAVAHAHSRLIVHRDIKPSNVLVVKEGDTRLLDFGVAKLLSGDGGSNDTQEIDTALTPAFAAPEQLLGGAVTTATDVFSLGLLLYVLLAGRNPREGSGTESVSELRALAINEPPKLSDYVTQTTTQSATNDTVANLASSPQALRRRLRGDLDNILQCAMAADPEDRYQTVAAFADDLQRYLRHEPVSAQAPTISYRVSKFVRRHRGGVLVGVLMLTALLASVVITTMQMIEAERQRDFALLQQQKLLATNEFLSHLLSDVGSNSEPLSLVELLDRGVELIDQQYDKDDRFVASTLFDISAFYSTLGAHDKRRSMLDRAFEIADRDGDYALSAHILCSRSRLDAYSNPEQARRDIDAALERLKKVGPENLASRVGCFRASGLYQAAAGNHEQAIADFQSALRAIESSPLDLRATQSNLLNDLAEQYFHLNQTDQAVQRLDESIVLEEASGRGNMLTAIITRMNRAAVVSRMGEVASAAVDQREALERLDRIGRPLVGARSHYGGSLMFLGHKDEALQLFKEELRAAEETGNLRWLANANLSIGTILAQQGDLERAETHLASAEEHYSKASGGQRRHLTRIKLARIQGFIANDDGEAALQLANSLLLELGYPKSDDAPGLMAALRVCAKAALLGGRPELARSYADRSYELAVSAARDETKSAHVGLALLQRGKAHLAENDRNAALSDLRRASEALAFGMGEDNEATLEARELLKST